MRKTFLDRAVAPLFGFLFSRGLARALQCFAVFHEAFGRIRSTVQQHIFNQQLQLGLDLFVNFEHSGIHNAHVHTGTDGVIQKSGMNCFANDVVAAKAKRNIGDAAAHFRVRQVSLDPTSRVDVINRVVVVLLHARSNGEDIGIENDVFRRKLDLIDQDPVGALAKADLVFIICGLTLFVEGHHHRRGAVFQDSCRVLAEFVFPFLQRNRIYDALTLQALQACLNDLPLRGVHHNGDFGDFGLARQHLQEARHRGDAINHALVHADVEHVRAVLNLLPGDAYCLFIPSIFDQLGKFRRTGNVGPFADYDIHALLLSEWLRSREAQRPPLRRVGDGVVGKAHARLSISFG